MNRRIVDSQRRQEGGWISQMFRAEIRVRFRGLGGVSE